MGLRLKKNKQQSPAVPKVTTWGQAPTTDAVSTWLQVRTSVFVFFSTVTGLYLQLHADVLPVFADVVQRGDGGLDVAAVFPVDQQPAAEIRRSKETAWFWTVLKEFIFVLP